MDILPERALAAGGRIAVVVAPAWSPDGRFIAFLRDGDVYVMRSNGRGLRRILDARQPDVDHRDRPWAELSAPSWQPLPQRK